MAGEDILSLEPPKADERLAYGADPLQFVDVRMPKSAGPFPVVINIHGGFWKSLYDLEYCGHICAALTAKGLATFNLEYRRVGNAGGGWPGTFEDIRNGYRFIRQMAGKYRLDVDRVLAMGHSAGGQLALCLAGHEPSLTRVVSLAGVVDLQLAYDLHLGSDAVVNFLGGNPEQANEHYAEADPMRLNISKAQQCLVHGTLDDIVPISLSRDYVAHKNKVGEKAKLLEFKDCGHFEIVDPATNQWREIEKSVIRLLG